MLSQYHKLITAEARQRLVLAETAEDRQRHRLQQLVAKHMAVGIVYLLKIVEIEVNHAGLAAISQLQCQANLLMDSVAIRQARHRVGIGHNA